MVKKAYNANTPAQSALGANERATLIIMVKKYGKK